MPIGERSFDLRQKLSVLVSCLILGIRFRERIIPIGLELETAPTAKQKELILRFQRELDAAEFEVIHFGVEMPKFEGDDSPLVSVMSDGDGKEYVKESIAQWLKNRSVLVDSFAKFTSGTADVSAELVSRHCFEIMKEVKPVNAKFINIIMDEIRAVEGI